VVCLWFERKNIYSFVGVPKEKNKHNQPRGQTIYQINQRLSVALQQGVGEQLIACECVG
jgi:hypothetical protein